MRTAPDDILKFRRVAFYLTQTFEQERWSIRYWTEIKKMTRHRRRTLLPATYHSSRAAAAHDNRRNNFLEQLGWKVLRFNTAQLRDELTSCMHVILNTIDRCGGMMLADETIRRLGVGGGDGSRQLPLF